MKILISFFFSFLVLFAEDFSYMIKIDKPKPYLKEAVILTLELNQSNKDVVLLFNFTLKKSDDYTFQRLDIRESDTYHNLKIKYTYLIYPLTLGEIKVGFDLLKKVTTDASIAYSFSGDRDNVKTLETKNTQVELKPLVLDVKALPQGTQIVGDFTLSYSIPKHQANAYEPLAFNISILGQGYPPLLSSLLHQKGNFRTFSEKPHVQSQSTLKGTKNRIKYMMAFSHKQDFSINPIEIKAFNPFSEQSYTLSIPKQNFKITQIESEALIDKIDNPKVLTIDFRWLKIFLSYMMVFLAGYITAYMLKIKRFSIPSDKENIIYSKIEACKTHKALLQLLLSLHNKNFDPLIEKIEKSLYSKEKTSLLILKKKALKYIL